ncbi:hypothetical protein SKAU_G00177150 [Synaphobranchus kaupii]|uniref:Uncharacterized protein n=1 Tax=Synaphobranchus kaupii TaxID=118154 RepID=A0A9Q1FM52_SYNKA|nr:hypothetical protein SKAU_G00177150 [Synaphobranchus kaupii]
MGLHLDMARTLLLMVLTTCICTQAALRGKSSAVDFLNHRQREKRNTEVSAEVSAEDSDGEGDSEAEELLMARPDYVSTARRSGDGEHGGGLHTSDSTQCTREADNHAQLKRNGL